MTVGSSCKYSNATGSGMFSLMDFNQFCRASCRKTQNIEACSYLIYCSMSHLKENYWIYVFVLFFWKKKKGKTVTYDSRPLLPLAVEAEDGPVSICSCLTEGSCLLFQSVWALHWPSTATEANPDGYACSKKQITFKTLSTSRMVS